ncbi:TonB-dependent receptor [Thiomicrorhabdus lithotrophica]|uniref:TonB-dependent receptor n=1 Tax=Thiomicrorhabdus lithotrophica TaxID=2949997 RepID=A0ABY8C922_9GAMM|nr:TonB-dependent receptor [Thiomicrorhabdus lithotrophica]WEJ62459.1 TonB-dependent receptor [Thiomicrorhabdus lithotrophica]
MKLSKMTLALCCATGSLPVFAQDVAESTLQSVTVSASPIHDHEIFEVPSQINVVTGRDKIASESGSLGQMLDGIPGVNNQSAGTQSGKPVVRGMTGNRVKVLSNGQSTDYQAYGTRHLPNVDPYLAERIEVIRGPQSVLYGAEAMGGIVNVIQAELPYGKAVSGELATEYNTNNQEKMFGAKVGAGSKEFAIQAGVSNRSADNFTVPNASTAPGTVPGDDRPLFVGEVPFTNFENRSANIGIGYQQDWGKIELRHTQWVSKQNYLGIDNAREPLAAGQKLQNDETQLKAEFYLDNDWVVKPSYTHTRNGREASHDLPYETMSEDKGTEHYLDLLVKRDDLKLAIEHPNMGDFQGEVGFELSEKEQVLRSGELTPSAKESKRAVYVFEEADYDKWLIQVGARYDWHEVSAPLDGINKQFVDEGIFDGTNNSRSFDVFSGSLGSTYRIDSNWSVAANLASGFRAPSIFELYAGGEHGGVQAFQEGNPDLKAETSLNTDLSLRWQAPKTQMVATVYQNWVDNYIYLANQFEADGVTIETTTSESGATIPVMKAQQTDAVINGFEFSVNHQFNQAWSSDLALELIEGRDTGNNQALPLMPANNARINVHYQPQDFAGLQSQKITVGVKLVDSKNAAGLYEPFSQFDDKPFGTASTDAYALWNLGYQAKVKLDKQNLYLAASVNNVFDTAYVDFLNTYKGLTLNTGRNVQLKARLDF